MYELIPPREFYFSRRLSKKCFIIEITQNSNQAAAHLPAAFFGGLKDTTTPPGLPFEAEVRAEAVLDDAGLVAAPVIGGQEAVVDTDVEGLLGVLRVYRNPDADGRLEVEPVRYPASKMSL